MLHTKKMRTLFAAADESGDGVLDALACLGVRRHGRGSRRVQRDHDESGYQARERFVDCLEHGSS